MGHSRLFSLSYTFASGSQLLVSSPKKTYLTKSFTALASTALNATRPLGVLLLKFYMKISELRARKYFLSWRNCYVSPYGNKNHINSHVDFSFSFGCWEVQNQTCLNVIN